MTTDAKFTIMDRDTGRPADVLAAARLVGWVAARPIDLEWAVAPDGEPFLCWYGRNAIHPNAFAGGPDGSPRFTLQWCGEAV